MRKILPIAFGLVLSMFAYAVPARSNWQTYTQADGSTIEIRLIGDEFCHFTINRAGQRVALNDAGMYEVVGEAPTPQQFRQQHARLKARRQRQDVGVKPNLAPKGVVIVANFSDRELLPSHTQATFDELCNSLNCTVNDGHPSAGQYFADQSNGAYRPQFDVFGPVNLTRKTEYYGKDINEQGNDQHGADAVVEACKIANKQFKINWADYDSDNDGYIDFVYLIYAGKGQASGGEPNTIWPHNWEISSARELYADGDEYGEHGTIHYCTYSEAECVVGGKYIENYACSAELSYDETLCGIGTLCHEFGHVMGLPDLYDTDYDLNYEEGLTPGTWDIMDAGSYNGDGHCPPNYDPWEKAFFGWASMENLYDFGHKLQIVANGKEGAKIYQINDSAKMQKPTDPGLCYYIENRQQQGWDSFVPGHGLLIWQVNYNEDIWMQNAPNVTSTQGSPLYSIVSAKGTRIGTEEDGPYNTFPGKANRDSIMLLPDRPLRQITETNDTISLIFIEELFAYTVRWMVNGELLESKDYNLDGSENLEMPTKEVVPCEGMKFLGWTKKAEWFDPFNVPDDLFIRAKGRVTRPMTYHAVFE